jgi:ureidoacrylate peracid hydrolase
LIGSDSQKRFSAMPEVIPTPGDTALIVIDMQYGNVHPDFGVGKAAKEAGRLDIMHHLLKRLPMITANIKRLQAACRKNKIEVIFVKMQSYTQDGRELSPSYKTKGFHWPAGSREAEILEDLKPMGDEIVLNKISTSAFATTPIDPMLRYMGIKKLLVAGVNTNYCVETFIREACDRGYEVVLVEDGCATLVEKHHQTTCEEVNDIFCKVKSTDQIIQVIGRIDQCK